MLIMQTVFFLVLFIFLVGTLGHHQPFETVLFAISLAVGLTPEFLPMITTVTLGQGAPELGGHRNLQFCWASSRSLKRWTLPVAVLGSDSTK